MTEDATYIAEFQPVNGIEGVERNGFYIFVQRDRLVFYGAEGEHLQIFDMMGRAVINCEIRNSNFEIHNSKFASGLYLVKVGNRTAQKVVIRHNL